MNTLLKAFENQNNQSFTNNGCITNKSSLDANLDFFFIAGGSRGKDISDVFNKAVQANEEVALRTLLWLRDIRGGAGERQLFRDLVKSINCQSFIDKIPDVGRWDDVLVFVGTLSEEYAFSLIQKALRDGNGLCAKWMPRKGAVANKLRSFLKMSPKQYRKTLVTLSNTVEQKMCAKQWDDIEFGKVPSVAAARYQKAFYRNAKESYEAYKEALVKGEAKINAGAVYPYDVLKSLKMGDEIVAQAQWDTLPDYLTNSEERFLPVVDVSGSMSSSVPGCTFSCIDVAISLGLYLSERNKTIFNNVMMTFSQTPELFLVEGDLKARYNKTQQAPWGMNTDIGAMFKVLLDTAKHNNVPEDEMPTSLLIVSDMEFDRCVRNGESVSAFDYAKQQYEEAGYKLPRIVFWTVNARSGNVPVKSNTTGCALVSGFSPSIMQSILKGGTDPVQLMLDTLMIDRYKY